MYLKIWKEKGAIYWGVKTLENTVTGGKNDNWVGNFPIVHMLKVTMTLTVHTISAKSSRNTNSINAW